MSQLRSFNKRNEAVEALRDGDTSEGLALIMVAWYDLALEICSGLGLELSDKPPVKEREQAAAGHDVP